MVHREHHLWQRLHRGHEQKRELEIVTQIVQTVSVVQQLDLFGSTIAIVTIDTNSHPVTSPPGSTSITTTTLEASTTSTAHDSSSTASASTSADTQPSSAIATTESQSSSPSSTATSTSGNNGATQSLPPISSTGSHTLSPLPSTTGFPHTTGLPLSLPSSSPLAGTNSTVPTSPLAASFSTRIMSTLSNSSFHTLSTTRTFISSDLSTNSASMSMTLSATSESASMAAHPTGALIGGGNVQGSVPTDTASASVPASTAAATTPPMPVVVGSVVGSIAGIAIILFALLYIIRWQKRRRGGFVLPANSSTPTIPPHRDDDSPVQQMAQRHLGLSMPAILAKVTPFAHHDHAHAASPPAPPPAAAAPEERGFYRVSGRKLESVLVSGGDGYSDVPGRSPTTTDGHPSTWSGSSFYRNSQGYADGRGSPVSVASPLQRDRPTTPVMQPGPAKVSRPSQGARLVASPQRPDLVSLSPSRPEGEVRFSGRSFNSSQGSRFTEEV